ncbi:MAG: winged helix-turn-helix domain-containing protein, partial [Nitrososphaerota archaeon]
MVALTRSLPPPNFSDLEGPQRGQLRRIVRYLAKSGGQATFKELLDSMKGSKSTLEYRLSSLEQLGFVERVKRGPVRLKFKTPLCYIFEGKGLGYAYFGLLGKRGEMREVSETETAVGLLERQLGTGFERVMVFSTAEAIDSWKCRGGLDEGLWRRIEWRVLSIKEMNSIAEVEEKVRHELTGLLSEYIVIMDCTSGTRPAGIAYYRLADTYKVPLVYAYEDKQT